MKSQALLETISELKDNIFKYLETRISYYGITAFEKAAIVLNTLVSRSVILLIFTISMIFISIAAAFYIGRLLQLIELGFLIVGGFYFLLGLVFYLLRDRVFSRFIIKTMLKILFTKDDDE